MLKTHASDDAAFVFDELMANPMEVGREVAAFLRRKQAKKEAAKAKAGSTFILPPTAAGQPSNVFIPGVGPLTITNSALDLQSVQQNNTLN